MKIAVTYENGNIFQHFGHSEAFKIYEIDDCAISTSEVVATEGAGHGLLAGFLVDKGVKILICGGIGDGAKHALADAKIKVVAGAEGNADEAVAAYLDGSLKTKELHDHSHEGGCCGDHDHGHEHHDHEHEHHHDHEHGCCGEHDHHEHDHHEHHHDHEHGCCGEHDHHEHAHHEHEHHHDHEHGCCGGHNH